MCVTVTVCVRVCVNNCLQLKELIKLKQRELRVNEDKVLNHWLDVRKQVNIRI